MINQNGNSANAPTCDDEINTLVLDHVEVGSPLNVLFQIFILRDQKPQKMELRREETRAGSPGRRRKTPPGPSCLLCNEHIATGKLVLRNSSDSSELD
jgi:hypothetical protein